MLEVEALVSRSHEDQIGNKFFVTNSSACSFCDMLQNAPMRMDDAL